MNEFVKPTIEYAQLWPLLRGLRRRLRRRRSSRRSCPARRRYVAQTMLAARRPRRRPGRHRHRRPPTWRRSATGSPAAARRRRARSPSTAPRVFLWGLLLVFGIGGVLLFAERHLEGGVSAFAGQAAALPGTDAEREASTPGLDHTEVYPLLMFALGGMMLFPAANDLLTLFVALEVLSLPLYLLCGLARRRRLLSQEAALKYFLLGAFSSGFFLYGIALIYGFAGSLRVRRDQRGGPQRRRQPDPAAGRHGHAGRRPVVQGRRRAVPGLDARRLPGRPDRRSPRSWRQPPRWRRSARCSGSSTSPSAPTAGAGSRCCGSSRS